MYDNFLYNILEFLELFPELCDTRGPLGLGGLRGLGGPPPRANGCGYFHKYSCTSSVSAARTGCLGVGASVENEQLIPCILGVLGQNDECVPCICDIIGVYWSKKTKKNIGNREVFQKSGNAIVCLNEPPSKPPHPPPSLFDKLVHFFWNTPLSQLPFNSF